MKRLSWLLIGMTLLAACAEPTPAASVPAVAPTESIPAPSADVVIASAKVEPAQISELGFTISAMVKEILVEEGDLVQAGQPLIILNSPELEFAVIAAEQEYASKSLAAELQKAEKVKYVNPNTGFIRWYPIPREVFLKALSRADQAKAVWDSAAANLAQSTLLAPFDGTVVDLQVIPGESAQTNQPVLVLADLKHLQIKTTDLSERDITRVKVGQPVEVYIEALDVNVPGKVIRISPIAEIVGGDAVFPVTIELSEQPAGLLWGMTTEVEIAIK